jgi:hypothetical protein
MTWRNFGTISGPIDIGCYEPWKIFQPRDTLYMWGIFGDFGLYMGS